MILLIETRLKTGRQEGKKGRKESEQATWRTACINFLGLAFRHDPELAIAHDHGKGVDHGAMAFRDAGIYTSSSAQTVGIPGSTRFTTTMITANRIPGRRP